MASKQGEKRTEQVLFRLTEDEYAVLTAIARFRNMTVNKLCLSLVVQYAQKHEDDPLVQEQLDLWRRYEESRDLNDPPAVDA